MIDQPSIPDRRTPRVWSQPSTLAAALVLTAAVIGLVMWRMQTPAPLPTTAPASRFSASRAMETLQQLLVEGQPHPAGSTANAVVRDRITSRLREMGYVVEIEHSVACTLISAQSSQCAPVYNLVAHLPQDKVDKAVLLAAHYDSVGAGPGASDDGSSVATLLEIARILAQGAPLRSPVLYLFTDAEEAYMMGARAFMERSPWSDKIGVVINLEARGASGQSLMFETGANNAWLVSTYASVVPNPATSALMVEAFRATGSGTDLTIFLEAGIPGLNLAFTDGVVRYHTPLDNLANLNPGSLQQQGDTALALARALAEQDLSQPRFGDSAYMDLLGFGVIHWPATWSLLLALLSFLVLLAVLVVMVRHSEIRILAAFLGFLAPLLVLALAVGLGFLLTWLIPLITASSAPWTAYPLPTRIALWTGALLSTALVSALMKKRVGWWGFSMGLWLFWALLATLLSLVMPGAAILFIAPVLAATGCITVVVLSPLRQSPLARAVAALIPAIFAGAVWLPSALHFEVTVGLSQSPAITGMVGLVAGTLLPCMALPRGKSALRTWLIGATAAVTLAAAITAVFVPPYSAASPQPINIYHFEDRDLGTAAWISIPFGDRTPQTLRSAFTTPAQAVFPWTRNEYLKIPSTQTTLPAPNLQVLSDTRSGNQRVVTVRLESARAPREFDLRVPIASLESLTVAGMTYSTTIPSLLPDPADTWSRYYHFYCYGSECNGLEVTLNLTTSDPVEVLISDRASGLPSAAEPLLQLRAPLGVPIHEGDETVILRRIKL